MKQKTTRRKLVNQSLRSSGELGQGQRSGFHSATTRTRSWRIYRPCEVGDCL